MKKLGRKKMVISIIAALTFVVTFAVALNKSNATVQALGADCWHTYETFDGCFVNVNGNMILVLGCRNGGNPDPGCYGGTVPPDEP